MSTLDTDAITNIDIASTHVPKDVSPLDGTTLDIIIIALGFDSGYAVPAVVTLRSIAENVQVPVTIYIRDCGLRAEDKQKIEASLPHRLNLTLVFTELPPDSISSTSGPNLHDEVLREVSGTPTSTVTPSLPREMRSCLWATVVPPWGALQFDVLLLDLVEIRGVLPEFERVKMKDARFWDQDPLILCFRGDLLWLNRMRNGRAIGSVAEWYDEERMKLPLKQ